MALLRLLLHEPVLARIDAGRWLVRRLPGMPWLAAEHFSRVARRAHGQVADSAALAQVVNPKFVVPFARKPPTYNFLNNVRPRFECIG